MFEMCRDAGDALTPRIFFIIFSFTNKCKYRLSLKKKLDVTRSIKKLLVVATYGVLDIMLVYYEIKF
jgi:hypothetical protein